MTALTVNMKPFVVTEEQFYELCTANPDLRFERSTVGEIVIMPPTGGETGARNMVISGQLWYWNDREHLGVAFDSSTGFRLPNGADRSPDAAWIVQARWDALTSEQRERFVPLCPDFVVELRSRSDDLGMLQDKMLEYMTNGARLGWLIDPPNQRVEVYRPGEPVEILQKPSTISGEPVLPGFQLNLDRILW